MPFIKKLRETEPFSQLPEHAFQELRRLAITVEYPENTEIFKQNEPSTGFLYVIKEGLVAITALSPGGLDMVVDYRKEGQLLGGTPIFTGQPYAGGARTVKPTTCYLIPENVLHAFQKDYPRIGHYFTQVVLSRVRNLYSEIVSENTGSPLAQMEAYPFKKHLSEIMDTPAVTCLSSTPVRDVARQLIECGVSGIYVADAQSHPEGIITERDMVMKVIAPENVKIDQLSARDVMRPHPHALPPETYMYEAMTYMMRHQLNHLAVVDRGELVGSVTARSLMRYRCQKAHMLLGNIREEATLQGLAGIHREIVKVARSLLSETRSTPEVMEILSYIHHAIMRRTFEICLAKMRQAGYQLPDIRFCFMIMGSGGRREMLLYPDQDNGFLFEDFDDTRLPEVEAFFEPFSEELTRAFDLVGYPFCDGNVMASNPAWRGRLRDWQARINEWVQEPEPVHVRNSSIFFDFSPLVGDASLVHQLHDIVREEIRAHPAFLYHMMTLDLRYKVPLGLLGRFVVEKGGKQSGKLSLKYGGSVYIVDCVRMFCLERGIQGVSTLERINALVKDNVLAESTAEHIRAAFEALIFLRLRHEIGLVEQGEPPSHFLDPTLLSKTEQDLLRESFQAVTKFQDATKRHFSHMPF
jgi:CBS domain-containing protein